MALIFGNSHPLKISTKYPPFPLSPMTSEKAAIPMSAIELSHHLSIVSRNRTESPLKHLQKYFGKPGLISLGGGLPSPEYFPFDAIRADVLKSSSFTAAEPSQSKGPFSWIWNIFSSLDTERGSISVPKYSSSPEEINLAVALQYSQANGLPQLQKLIQEFTCKIFKPAYSNFTTLINGGNTDGWSKIITALCNPGEGVLTSEWTYPSALAAMVPFGIHPIPVAMDGQGMSSIALRELLAQWDVESRGISRPHVMYIIPIGQNPTGATMQGQRKKEIYQICVEYDIIIVEDDPYYFLQEGTYVPPSRRPSILKESNDEVFVANLAPSFLAFDYQGRVVRLDTFSKIIAPGCRMGWFTFNPQFYERVKIQIETSTQTPCGFSQSLVASLLINWQYTGTLRWLQGLRNEYTKRRDFFVDCIAENFHLELAPPEQNRFQGSDMYIASHLKVVGEKVVSKPLFSFVPPTSGMFVWLQLLFDGHPKFGEVGQNSLEVQLWEDLAEAGVLFGPGYFFASNSSVLDANVHGHYRISFSNAQYSDLRKAVEIFAQVLIKFYESQ